MFKTLKKGRGKKKIKFWILFKLKKNCVSGFAQLKRLIQFDRFQQKETHQLFQNLEDWLKNKLKKI